MESDSANTEPAHRGTNAAWFVVATKSRDEKIAKVNLERQGYLVFLPTISLKKRRRGHWTPVTEPLFPGYLFVSLILGTDDPAPIRSTVGCVGLVRFGPTHTPVPADLIASLGATAINDGQAPAPFQSGDAVRLVSGPFAGLEAVYDMPKGEDRAQVLLEVLGGVQRLNLEMDALSK
jgi:transcriptional antiterminator RfaH